MSSSIIARGRPRVPWGQDPRARSGIPLLYQHDPRRYLQELAQVRLHRVSTRQALDAGYSSDAAAYLSTGRTDPIATGEVARWQSMSEPIIVVTTIDQLRADGGRVVELARFSTFSTGAGVIEKIQAFTRVEELVEGEPVEVYAEGPLVAPLPPIGSPISELGFVRVYALTLEVGVQPEPRVGVPLPFGALPLMSVADHPYSWFDSRYATSQQLGNHLRLTVGRLATVRLWAGYFADEDTIGDEPIVITFAGHLAGFRVAAGATDASYWLATGRSL